MDHCSIKSFIPAPEASMILSSNLQITQPPYHHFHQSSFLDRNHHSSTIIINSQSHDHQARSDRKVSRALSKDHIYLRRKTPPHNPSSHNRIVPFLRPRRDRLPERPREGIFGVGEVGANDGDVLDGVEAADDLVREGVVGGATPLTRNVGAVCGVDCDHCPFYELESVRMEWGEKAKIWEGRLTTSLNFLTCWRQRASLTQW